MLCPVEAGGDPYHRFEGLAHVGQGGKAGLGSHILQPKLAERHQLFGIVDTLTHDVPGWGHPVKAHKQRNIIRSDQLLQPLYAAETDPEYVRQLTHRYMMEIDALKATANLPFALGGTDAAGISQVNEMSYIILRAYEETKLPDTKLHILWTPDMPRDFLELCMRCIRDGGNSLVFINNQKMVDGLVKLGLARKHAADFSIVGCYESSGGGVTLSGGECLAQPEFVIDLAKTLSAEGIRVDIDTCGFVRRDILERIAPYTDTFLYDIKAIDPVVHKACTGQENGLILDNLRWLCENGCKVEIRYPYVPGWNDSQCDAIGAFLKDLPGITKIKVLGYHGYAGGKYAALDIPSTLPDVTVTAEDVEVPVGILRSYGLNAINGMLQD